MNKHYIKGFDGLRAISILLVIVSHWGVLDWHNAPVWYQRNLMIFSGLSGVNIFFVLSGFLITRLLLTEHAESNRISLLKFYARRFLRLLPPLLLFFAIALAFRHADRLNFSNKQWLHSFFYMYNFEPRLSYIGEFGHTWSLAVEEQFYLVWPVLLFLFTKKSARLAPALLLLLSCLAFKIYLAGGSEQALNWNKLYQTDRWFIPAVAPIMLGSVAALFTHYHPAIVTRVFKGGHWWLIVAAIIFLMPFYAPASLLPFYYMVQSLASILVLLLVFENAESAPIKILEWRPLQFIGKISYGLYVFQGFFLRTGPYGRTLEVQQFPWNILLTFAVAVASYYALEKPALRLKKYFR